MSLEANKTPPSIITSATQTNSNGKLTLALFLGTLAALGAEHRDSTSATVKSSDTAKAETARNIEEALGPSDHEIVKSSKIHAKEKDKKEAESKAKDEQAIASWKNITGTEGIV